MEKIQKFQVNNCSSVFQEEGKNQQISKQFILNGKFELNSIKSWFSFFLLQFPPVECIWAPNGIEMCKRFVYFTFLSSFNLSTCIPYNHKTFGLFECVCVCGFLRIRFYFCIQHFIFLLPLCTSLPPIWVNKACALLRWHF